MSKNFVDLTQSSDDDDQISVSSGGNVSNGQAAAASSTASAGIRSSAFGSPMYDTDSDSSDDTAAGPAASGGGSLNMRLDNTGAASGGGSLSIRPGYSYTGRLQAGGEIIPTNPSLVARGDGGMSLSKRPYQKEGRGAFSKDSMLGDNDDDGDDDATESDSADKDDLGGDDNGPAAGGKKRKLEVDNYAGSFTFARLPYPLEYSERTIDPRTIGTYKEVLLRSDSGEFLVLKNRFERNGAKIFKAYRIEDPLKMAIFQLELASLKEKHNPDPIAVETLYHSSSDNNNYDSILKNNFSMKYCARGMLGSGIYFSQEPIYSMDTLYSSRVRANFGVSSSDYDHNTKLEAENLERTRIMLACDVILGKTLFIINKSGNHADMVAPIEHFQSHGSHENMMGLHFDIFCVFSNKRVLPRYVIYYDNYSRFQTPDNLKHINTIENLTVTNSQYPLPDRIHDEELKRQHGNDRELVVELQNTPKKQMYSYANQRSSNRYDLVVKKFQ